MSKSSVFPPIGQVSEYVSDESLALRRLDNAYSSDASKLRRDYEVWLFKNPDASHIPSWFTPLFNQWEREDEVRAFQVRDPQHQRDLEKMKNQLEAELPGHSKRRAQELKLADYIEKEVSPLGAINYRRGDEVKREHPRDIVSRLRSCRQVATIGIKPGGGIIAVYDEKCGFSKLCPDESREESKRLAEEYIPAVIEFKKQHRGNTFQYAVFTLPNYPAGKLEEGKKEINARFSKLLKRNCMEHAAGSLVIQEDPLSASGDWNIHLNVIFAVNGFFDWKTIREAWGFNIHFESEEGLQAKTRNNLQRKGLDTSSMDDITVLSHAFREISKYAGSPIATKSAQKSDDGQSKAPAMTAWPGERWVEWWSANKGFRRTRSYGVLYDPDGYRWETASEDTRASWLRKALLQDWQKVCPWRRSEDALEKEDRDLLRDAMNEREVLNLDEVEWVGGMRYCSEHGYRVHINLIPEDNFVFSDDLKHRISLNPSRAPPFGGVERPNVSTGANYA